MQTILSIDIRFPDLGTKEKKVKRMRKSQDVPSSYSETIEPNSIFDSAESLSNLGAPYCLAHQDFWHNPAP